MDRLKEPIKLTVQYRLLAASAAAVGKQKTEGTTDPRCDPNQPPPTPIHMRILIPHCRQPARALLWRPICSHSEATKAKEATAPQACSLLRLSAILAAVVSPRSASDTGEPPLGSPPGPSGIPDHAESSALSGSRRRG